MGKTRRAVGGRGPALPTRLLESAPCCGVSRIAHSASHRHQIGAQHILSGGTMKARTKPPGARGAGFARQPSTLYNNYTCYGMARWYNMPTYRGSAVHYRTKGTVRLRLLDILRACRAHGAYGLAGNSRALALIRFTAFTRADGRFSLIPRRDTIERFQVRCPQGDAGLSCLRTTSDQSRDWLRPGCSRVRRPRERRLGEG